MNWYRKLLLAQSNEFWIDEYGTVYDADIDVSGIGHEAQVIGRILGEYDFDQDDMDGPTIADTPDDVFRSRGMTNEEIAVIRGSVDARTYAFDKWGWVRGVGTNLEVNGLNSSTLNIIADGVYELYDEQAEEMTYDIEDKATGVFYADVPWEILANNDTNGLMAYRPRH